jgi:hypothetical protein
MLSPNPYMTLSTALGFSAADLNANRHGVLTPYQRGMLINQRLRTLTIPTILTLLLVIVGYLLQAEFILIAFIAACLMTTMLATWQRFQEDLESPVEVVIGQWSQRTLFLGRQIALVNGRTFNLPKHLKNTFNENVRYRLYYTAGTRTILSAEIL